MLLDRLARELDAAEDLGIGAEEDLGPVATEGAELLELGRGLAAFEPHLPLEAIAAGRWRRVPRRGR